jgi:CBS domain containing-hemolysin-like protein
MGQEAVQIIRLVVFFALQFMLSGGIAAFTVISRVHEDKVFPKGSWGSFCPRLLHRNRLHLFLTLITIEVSLLIVIAIDFFDYLSRVLSGTGAAILPSVILPVLLIAVVVLLVSIVGLSVATKSPRTFAYIVSYPFLPLYLIARPLTGMFFKFASWAFPDLPREIASSIFVFNIAGEGGEGFIEENGSRLMHSIVEFGVKKVREVMVPRIDVFALDIRTPVDEAREMASDVGHSRVPVYDGSMDKIVGILFVKDLLRAIPGREGELGMLAREAYFVPEGKKIDDLLREFQVSKKHMAIVVDEYGGTSGIVTLEDILEEIVGEIRDEHDYEVPLIRKVGQNEYMIAGRISLDDLEENFGISLPTEEVDTLGGFLYNLIGKVPGEGEEIEHEGILFRVSRLEGQRIADVSVKLPPDSKDMKKWDG